MGKAYPEQAVEANTSSSFLYPTWSQPEGSSFISSIFLFLTWKEFTMFSSVQREKSLLVKSLEGGV